MIGAGVYAGMDEAGADADPDDPCGSVSVPGFPVYGLMLPKVLQLLRNYHQVPSDNGVLRRFRLLGCSH